MWILRTLSKVPPGQFSYEQTEGIPRKFQSTGEPRKLAQEISNFRRGNRLPRAEFHHCLQDVVAHTSARLAGMKDWTHETNLTIEELFPEATVSGCASCGGK